MAKDIELSGNLYEETKAMDGDVLSPKLSITSPEFQFETIEAATEKGNNWIKSKDFSKAEYCYAAGFKLAMEQKDTNQQIRLVQMIGATYSERKQYEGYTKAAALYNYALNLCQIQIKALEQLSFTDPIEVSAISMIKDLLIDKLNTIEIGFVQYVTRGSAENIEYSSKYFNDSYQSHLDILTSIRLNAKGGLEKLDKEYNLDKAKIKETEDGYDEEYKEQLFIDKTAGIRQIFAKINDGMKGLVVTMITECHKSLGKPPCKYAIIGFGSLARGEATPYSDFEWAILIAEDTSENKQYFRNLTNLLHIKILNLGETILPSMAIRSLDWYYDDITPRGFAFDGQMSGACKTPLGKETIWYENQLVPGFELIHTPVKMAKFQQEDWYQKDKILPYELLTVTFIDGNHELVDNYKKEIKKQLNIYTSYNDSKVSIREKRALLSIEHDIDRFIPNFDVNEQGKLHKIKHELYRLPAITIEALCLLSPLEYQDIPSSNVERIIKLKDLRFFNEEFSDALQSMIINISYLRLKNYIDKQRQEELFDHSDNLSLYEKYLFNIYRTLIPLYKNVKRLSEGNIKTLFTVNTLCSDKVENEDHRYSDLLELTSIYMRLYNVYKAKELYAKFLLEVYDKDETALINVGQLLIRQGLYEESYKYFDKLLEGRFYANVKGEVFINSKAITDYCMMAMCLNAQKKFKEAIDIVSEGMLLMGRCTPALQQESPYYKVYTALAYSTIANNYYLLDKLNDSFTYQKDAYDSCKDLTFDNDNMQMIKVRVICLLGKLSAKNNDFINARRLCDEALESYKNFSSGSMYRAEASMQVAHIYTLIGKDDRTLSDHKTALKYYDEAFEIINTYNIFKHDLSPVDIASCALTINSIKPEQHITDCYAQTLNKIASLKTRLFILKNLKYVFMIENNIKDYNLLLEKYSSYYQGNDHLYSDLIMEIDLLSDGWGNKADFIDYLGGLKAMEKNIPRNILNETLFEQGIKYFQDKDYTKATTYLENSGFQHHYISSKNGLCNALLGLAYYRSGFDYEKAKQHLIRACIAYENTQTTSDKKNNTQIDLLRLIAELTAEISDPHRTYICYRKLADIYEYNNDEQSMQYAVALKHMSNSLFEMEQGYYKQAKIYAEKARTILRRNGYDVNEPAALVLRGLMIYGFKEPNVASKTPPDVNVDLATLAPKNTASHAIAHFRMKNYTEAIKIFSKIIDNNPVNSDFTVFYNRGRAYHENGNWIDAIGDYNTALSINSEHTKSGNQLKICHEQLELADKTVTKWKNYVQVLKGEMQHLSHDQKIYHSANIIQHAWRNHVKNKRDILEHQSLER